MNDRGEADVQLAVCNQNVIDSNEYGLIYFHRNRGRRVKYMNINYLPIG